MKKSDDFIRIYFYSSQNLKEPKNKQYKFDYRSYKSILGLSSYGFYFDLPISSSITKISNREDFDKCLYNQYRRDMFNCGIDIGERLYSLIYGKRMPNLQSIFVKLPNERVEIVDFSLTTLLGTEKYRFNKIWSTKRMANIVISKRKKDKIINTILNCIITGAFIDNNYSKFSHIFPAVEPYLVLAKRKPQKSGDIEHIKEFLKDYTDDFDVKPSDRKIEGKIKIIRSWLVEQAFLFMGKYSLDSFLDVIKNNTKINENPSLERAIETYQKDNKSFVCKPLPLLLIYAPYRFRCDFFHGNEPSFLYTTKDNLFYKGIGVYSEFLLQEIEKSLIKTLLENK